MTVTEILEIHMEELRQHSREPVLVGAGAGPATPPQCRFVARAPGRHHEATDHLVVGEAFPVSRAQDLDDRTEPNSWLDTARDRLAELDRLLLGDGWQRRAGPGRHWWSLSYARLARA